jgi:hypothetical protein
MPLALEEEEEEEEDLWGRGEVSFISPPLQLTIFLNACVLGGGAGHCQCVL